MAKQLQCECGFTAGGKDATMEQLQNIAVQHIKDVHPEMLREHGEPGVREMTPSFIHDI